MSLAMLSALLLLVVQTASAAEQPIGFSHTAHIEKASMQCTDCHEGATSRDSAGLPSIRKCMLCHQFIATDLPEVVRLSKYWERKHEVPWERIYGFAKTAAVQFRHAPHARAEIACSQCHGDVASMTVAVEAVTHTMGSCIQCHRDNSATDDCLACHF
ncbi:MAG: cytochrome c3 family protein [Acidobacteriia bacterium]|nr:cytochrome c3 family protein [Terriglobia bacterium]